MRGVPRLVWVLAASRFVTSVSSFLILFLTLYLTGPRGLGPVAAGVVSGAYGVGMLLGNFTGGRWGDVYGHRRTLLVTSTVSGLGVAAVPWLPVGVLVVELPVMAYLGATASVSVGALAALSVERGNRRTAVAISRAASNAGFVIGPPLGALLALWSYDALFVVDGLATLAVRFAVSPLLPREEPGHASDRPTTGLFTALRADRALVRLLMAVVAVDLVYRQLYTTVPLHLRDSGQPLGLYASMIAVGSGLILVCEIPVAVRLRRFSAYPIIAVGYALVGVGFVLFGLPVTVATAVIAMVVVTAGEILYKTTATAHVLDAAPDHLVGQYQGLYNGASTSGTILAGPVGGAVYVVAPSLLWPLCGVVGVGAAIAVMAGRSRGPRAGSGEPASSRVAPG